MSQKVKQLDSEYLGRDVPSVDLQITRSQGSYLYDDQGKKYIDFVAGWCVGNIGWEVKEVCDTINKFNGPTYVDPYYLYEPWVVLAKLLAEIAPGDLQVSFRATGGTEAVEIALQAAMAHTKRHKFISVSGAYHGHSIGAMSIGLNDFRTTYPNLLPGCFKIDPPLDKKAALQVEKLISKGDIAAYISEPIICNLGVLIPTQEYYDIIQSACKKYGTLFIIDEVATGFGRTGKLFASEHYDLKPDIMCLGKGLTGGYAALGATITTKEVAESMKFSFSLYSTFGWQPLNTAAALANLNYLLKNKDNILINVTQVNTYIVQRLKSMKFAYPATIRAKGLAIGVQFEDRNYVFDLVNRCRQHGLLISMLDINIFTIFPALTISQEDAHAGLDILEASL